MNPGDTVSHFRILSLLGSGGMGVVYLAEDLTLGRKLALKFLSRDFARDRTAVERFRREARTASALNHPHICTIHEISEHDGQPFIAMEWLEGQSLRDLLRARRPSLEELLTLATDVADGLDAAHRAGVVHRDIKPGNIFVLARNRAKLLDFGLAKMNAPGTAPHDLPTAMTADAMQLTDSGMTLGTLAYMSPEQARGETLDARSDLFSLGVVLYEAFTGTPPFKGPSSAVVFHEILGKTPESPLRLNPNTPPDFDRLIMKALEKDRDIRSQSAAEMLSDLKRLKRDRDSRQPPSGISSGSVATAPVVATAPQAAASAPATATVSTSSSSDVQLATELLKRHRIGMLIGAVALALILAGVFYLAGAWRSQHVATAQDMQVEQISSDGNASRPAISPDGKFVAYMSGGGVWIRQTATSSNVQIVERDPGFSGVAGLTISPDSNFVDFVRIPPTIDKPPSLWRVPFLGGAPKLIVEDVHSAIGWSPDGRRMAFIRGKQAFSMAALIIADADGRNQKVLAEAERTTMAFQTVLVPGAQPGRPAWSPDGRVIAYPARVGKLGLRVAFVNTSDGKIRTLPPDSVDGFEAYGVDWIDGSSLVLARASDGQLWRLSYPDGNLTRMTNDVNTYTGVSVGTDRNTMVTARLERHGSLWIANGAATEGTETPQAFGDPNRGVLLEWNADRLVFSGPRGILGLSVKGGQPEDILKNAANPAFTSDGRTMVYVSREAGSLNGSLWKTGSNGSNPVQLVAGVNYWPLITSDDQNVIYASFGDAVLKLWMVPLAGGKPTPVNAAWAALPVLSPDGKSLAFGSQDQNRWFISVCDLPACSELRHVRQMDTRAFTFRWTPDGRAIAYTPIGENIFVHPLDGSPEQQLTHFTDRKVVLDFAWSRDGKHLAVARNSISRDIVLFRGIKPTS